MKGLPSEKDICESWGGCGDTPMVSICCNTYNHEKYIKDALAGFLNQVTRYPFEVLVYDDASTDGTVEVLRAYKEKYPGIIMLVLQEENQFSKGVSPFLSLIEMAKGSYIAICEGDDYWTDDNKLEAQVEFLENNKEYVITYTDCAPFDESGAVKKNYGGITRDASAVELKKSLPIYTLTACFRNIVDKIPEDLKYVRVADQVMWSLLGKFGNGKYLSNVKPSAYRVHDRGVFSKRSRSYRYQNALFTSNALYAYYARGGDTDIAQYYLERSYRLMTKKLIVDNRLGKMVQNYIKWRIFK